MKLQTLLVAIALLLISKVQLANAQTPQEVSSSDILQKLKKLNTVGSVLYIAAHPDDENTRLLGYLANERKLKTGYLSLTRGDGGQNLIGKEQGEMLGLIRTQELLAARRVDGAEQFFSRAYDFGFSKNPEEAFAFWNKDSVLSDVVWVIRKFQPDVIICRFPTTGEGGHGHHTASAIVALEAFGAAADPKRFPEQLKEVGTWQAKRIFWNTFKFGSINTTSEDQLKIDVGGYNPLIGKSYGEMAAESRSNHKSQGFGSAKSRGTTFEYFKQLKGDTARKDLFDGIENSWNRYPNTTKFKTLLAQCIAQYNVQFPEKSLANLMALYTELMQLGSSDKTISIQKEQKLKELKEIIIASAGLWLESNASDYSAIPGKEIQIQTELVCRNKAAVSLKKIHYPASDTAVNIELKRNNSYSFSHTELLPQNTAYSTPYWLLEPHSAGAFSVHEQKLIGMPENKPALHVGLSLTIAGKNIELNVPVVYKSTDPVKGEVYRPLEVLPPATVNASEGVYVFSNAKAKKIRFVIKANTANVSGTLKLELDKGWSVQTEQSNFKLDAKNDEAFIDVLVSPDETANTGNITATLIIEGKEYDKNIRRIDYDHIPAQFTLAKAQTKLVRVHLKKLGTQIGYIPGAGDEVPACLQQIGYTITILDDEALAKKDLSDYDAIITGIRAFNTNEHLKLYHKKLMNYVNKGGNLIVQYNTNNRLSTIPQEIGPYPFEITRNRVTDENAAVMITQKEHPVFNFPNKIEEKDFENWIQERGIYFATDSQNKYQKPISMKDPNEASNDGSLLIASYGKGYFVYTGLAFFRQLPAGVPGAYRLFVNLLSLTAEDPKK